MRRKIDRITEENYERIFRYCKMQLNGNIDAAQECTQETFLLLCEKQASLNFNRNIRAWLYAAAARIVLEYKKKEARRLSELTDEPVSELPDETGELQAQESDGSSPFRCLSEQEKELLHRYFEDNADHSAIAKELGVSLNALYQRIHIIKKKIQNALNLH